MTTPEEEKPKIERRLEKEIEIDAPVEEVWKALTEGPGLRNWLSLDARVTPGLGGKIFISWGPDFEGEVEIVVWEPGKRLGYRDPMAVVDFLLEARGGKTLLRLVQSLFLSGADWENEWFDSTGYGWGFMLVCLQWWLEVHPREDRQVVWPRVKTELSRSEVYGLLMKAGVLFAESPAEKLREGAAYQMKATTGDDFSGVVEFIRGDRGFCVSVKELNNALLWFTIEGVAPKIEVQAWLSGFGLPEAQLTEFGDRWEKKLKEVFGAAVHE
jgi:uncharacterized protein YndB with AHSA1/START domain